MDGWLPASAGAHLRSGAEMADRFSRYPGAVENTVAVADAAAFELRKAKPGLPAQEVPAGETPMSWLRKLVRKLAPERYPKLRQDILDRLEQELAVIAEKDF